MRRSRMQDKGNVMRGLEQRCDEEGQEYSVGIRNVMSGLEQRCDEEGQEYSVGIREML